MILDELLVVNGIGFLEMLNNSLSLWIWTEEIEHEYPFCIGFIEIKEIEQ